MEGIYWTDGYDELIGADGEVEYHRDLLGPDGYDDGVLHIAADWKPDEDRLQRLAACYNALAGINPAAVPKMLETMKLFMRYDAENCQDETTSWEDVRAAVASALSLAQPQPAK